MRFYLLFDRPIHASGDFHRQKRLSVNSIGNWVAGSLDFIFLINICKNNGNIIKFF